MDLLEVPKHLHFKELSDNLKFLKIGLKRFKLKNSTYPFNKNFLSVYSNLKASTFWKYLMINVLFMLRDKTSIDHVTCRDFSV